MTEPMIIGPQPGPQTAFLETEADIAIFGGSAGSGKSWSLLLDTLRHWENPQFGAVIFRRSTTQVRNEGGLWDQSMALYGPLGAKPRESVLEWVFPAGGRVKFAHLEHEKTRFDWQGSQIPVIGFDEICHFTAEQFWYMFSRNRSTSGIKPYIRATCNPDPDSFVRKLIDWWIGPDGFPIPERSGVLRWFIRVNGEIIWGDSPEELIEKYGKKQKPKSLTFIPAKLSDNQILMREDPGYEANLMAMSLVDRERLLHGNWNIRASSGLMFRREWFPLIDAIPAGWVSVIRFWDRAATEPNATNPDPDWTRGLKLYKYPDGTWVVADLKSERANPGRIMELIKNVASHDGVGVRIMAQQDPGSAGVEEMQRFTRELNGYPVIARTIRASKENRAHAVSAQCLAGNVKVLKADWNDELFTELEAFPNPSAHDDICDCLSGGDNELLGEITVFDNMSGFRGLLG